MCDITASIASHRWNSSSSMTQSIREHQVLQLLNNLITRQNFEDREQFKKMNFNIWHLAGQYEPRTQHLHLSFDFVSVWIDWCRHWHWERYLFVSMLVLQWFFNGWWSDETFYSHRKWCNVSRLLGPWEVYFVNARHAEASNKLIIVVTLLKFLQYIHFS